MRDGVVAGTVAEVVVRDDVVAGTVAEVVPSVVVRDVVVAGTVVRDVVGPAGVRRAWRSGVREEGGGSHGCIGQHRCIARDQRRGSGAPSSLPEGAGGTTSKPLAEAGQNPGPGPSGPLACHGACQNGICV